MPLYIDLLQCHQLTARKIFLVSARKIIAWIVRLSLLLIGEKIAIDILT